MLFIQALLKFGLTALTVMSLVLCATGLGVLLFPKAMLGMLLYTVGVALALIALYFLGAMAYIFYLCARK